MAHEPRQGGTGTLSVEEYLDLERTTGVKHEYVLGQVYALAGASEAHNRIAPNIAAALLPAARATGCRVLGSDQKLRPGNDLYCYYPDVQVLCDPTDDDRLVKRRPCVIVEVSNNGTGAIDRCEKLLVYRVISSLLLYLIVARPPRGDRAFEHAAGVWRTRQAEGANTISIGLVPCSRAIPAMTRRTSGSSAGDSRPTLRCACAIAARRRRIVEARRPRPPMTRALLQRVMQANASDRHYGAWIFDRLQHVFQMDPSQGIPPTAEFCTTPLNAFSDQRHQALEQRKVRVVPSRRRAEALGQVITTND